MLAWMTSNQSGKRERVQESALFRCRHMYDRWLTPHITFHMPSIQWNKVLAASYHVYNFYKQGQKGWSELPGRRIKINTGIAKKRKFYIFRQYFQPWRLYNGRDNGSSGGFNSSLHIIFIVRSGLCHCPFDNTP